MPDQPRTIIHLDLDAFFAAVEVLEDPELAGKPVLVGGRSGRGVVAASSYPARRFGIHSAMPMYRALQLCPQAVVMPPRHRLYRQYSRRVMEILHQVSPMVEQMSIDEAFLDLTDQVEPWEAGVEVGLSASLGVAANKLVAKVASDRDKPGGLTVVRPGEEAAFLGPLPVRVLWGVGPVTAGRLAEAGVKTAGDLAGLSPEELWAHFGERGATMARQAQGIDRRRVVTEHERKSVSQERTFPRDLADPQELRRKLWQLSQGVAKYLKRSDVAAGTIAVKLRFYDFRTLTRQMRLMVPTNDERMVYRAALALLDRAWQPRSPVRLACK